MALTLKDSHIALRVQNSSCKNQNLYVGAFSGFVVIGTLEGLNFSKNSLVISVDNLEKLNLEIQNLLSFFASNQCKESEPSCFEDFFWRGEIKDGIQTVFYYKNKHFLFTININELISITKCLSKVIFFSFLFKDLEILFFQSLLKDCLNDISIEILQTNKNALAIYVTKFVDDLADDLAANKNQCAMNNKAALITLFDHYIKELKNVCVLLCAITDIMSCSTMQVMLLFLISIKHLKQN
jgi:hypothetical protein